MSNPCPRHPNAPVIGGKCGLCTFYPPHMVVTSAKIEPKYPYEDGDVTVLGPEVFVNEDGSVISWKGENYYRGAAVVQSRRSDLDPEDAVCGPECSEGHTYEGSCEATPPKKAPYDEAVAKVESSGPKPSRECSCRNVQDWWQWWDHARECPMARQRRGDILASLRAQVGLGRPQEAAQTASEERSELYFCPQVGEIESAKDGGFDQCCSKPELHVPLPETMGTKAMSDWLSENAKTFSKFRETNRNLHRRLQQAESVALAVQREVEGWRLGEGGWMYVPLNSIVAIAKAAGREDVESEHFQVHYQRVEKLEQENERLKRDLQEHGQEVDRLNETNAGLERELAKQKIKYSDLQKAMKSLMRALRHYDESLDTWVDRTTPQTVRDLVDHIAEVLPPNAEEERDFVWAHYRLTHRVLTRRLDKAEKELAALHEGEEEYPGDHLIPTPPQFIGMWNNSTPELRMEMAEQILRDRARLSRLSTKAREFTALAPNGYWNNSPASNPWAELGRYFLWELDVMSEEDSAE